MAILDDTAIFTSVVQQGGFARAAKQLGLSNGLISRRIAKLEQTLGVTLIKRTTRALQLTTEGELFWQHAVRIQQELDAAVSLIQSCAKKPKGEIKITSPHYFGSHYLTEMLMKFIHDFPDIKIKLNLSNQNLDPIKNEIDLVIRGVGFVLDKQLKDSSLKGKLLLQEKVGLYASDDYLKRFGKPDEPIDLQSHHLIYFHDDLDAKVESWRYWEKSQVKQINIKPFFYSNDIESNLMACISGHGIGKFTELNVREAMSEHKLQPVLQEYNWGFYRLYAIYPRQQTLPKRTRLLLDFISAHTKKMIEKEI